MNSLSKQNSLHAALATVAVAGAILATSPADAQVIFDDGKMHVIDDDTYAFDLIEVRNGSKLKIVEGAVISAEVYPNYDFLTNDSGLEVLDYSAAAIQVFDKSMVIVQGGVFGGEAFDPNPEPYGFLNNWYSGAIAAFDQSKVIVQGGTFGRSAFRSGTLAMFDDARLIISGGTFTNPGGSGGRIELFENSEGKISGGTHGSTINPVNQSTLKISGGFFGKNDGFTRGAILALGSANVKISGGHFGAGGFLSGFLSVGGEVSMTISGGTFGGTGMLAANLNLLDEAYVRITGGEFSGSNINVNGGLVEIEGAGFSWPFGPLNATDRTNIFGDIWIGSTNLEGVLANGDSIDVTVGTADSDDALIELIAE